MLKDQALRQLTLFDLNMLLENVRLGPEHLKKMLAPEQLKELLSMIEMSKDQKQNIKLDSLEKLGNATLVINTILTTILGTWFGLAGFMGIGFRSLNTLILLTLLSAITSGYLGVRNYKIVKKTYRDSLLAMKLKNFEKHVIYLIFKKRRRYLHKKLKFINQLTTQSEPKIELTNKFDKCPQINLSWLNNLKSQNPYALKIQKIENIFLKNNLLPKQPEIHALMDQSFKTILTKKFAINIKPTSSIFWWKGKVGEILIGFIPTFFGSFGAFFVYFAGIPDAIKKLGLNHLDSFLKNTHFKAFEILVASLLACYFTVTYLNNHRKSAKRKIELNKIQNRIVNLEICLAQEERRIEIVMQILKPLMEG